MIEKRLKNLIFSGLTFKDLVFNQHRSGFGGVQAILEFDNGHRISVVGGREGLYGDGVNTFEIWRSCDDDVKGWLTPEEVTEEMIELQNLPNGGEHNPLGF
jgi:hypothetical protein